MGSSDVKLQLIIEAINRSEAALGKLKQDLADVEAAGAAGTGAMQGLGPSIARARDHVSAMKNDLPGLKSRLAEIDIAGIGAGKALEVAGEKGAAGLDRVHDHAQRSHSMLGQMVQMALLFGSMALAEKLASSAIDYNKALETSKLGIAAIMTSMGVITDQQGTVLAGQEKWNAAQQLSVEAQKELEKIAMTTPATYQEMVQAYQGLLAPALAAKLTFKETLELSGLLTNSVKAMGLPVQQIVQEGRDLVAGTIDQNSQLARSLQITNEDVKKWREKGTVFQEIKGRLDGFIFASRAFENTWEGAWSNFKDIAQHALGDGSKPLFNYLKGEIGKITLDMVNITRDADGKIIDIQVKPETVARIRELAENLKRLIEFLELAVKWGGKLAEPALYLGIAIGIGKITTAVKELGIAANAGGLAKLLSSLPTLALVAGMWAGKQYADAKSLSADATGIRVAAQVDRDHDSSRLKNSGVNTLANIDQFGWKELANVRQKLPTADDAQIAAMLRRGIIGLQKETVPGFDKEYRLVVQIDDAKAKQFLDGGKAPFDLKGSNKKTPAELKKEREAFIAAMEDSYAESAGKFKVGEAQESEAIKTGLKEKELAWQQGIISEGQYLQARADLEEQARSGRLKEIAKQQSELTQKYQLEAGQITDPKEASEKHKAYVTAWYALEIDYQKQVAEKKRAGFEEELKQAAEQKKLTDARREGALKLLQEQLNGEKQLTQQLLERGKITPLAAEKRNIAGEQAGLESDYWNAFAKKHAGGMTAAQIAELDAQLTVLEERMQNLDRAVPDRLYKAGKESSSLEAKRDEARISHELSDLEERQKLREVGKSAALQQRITLSKELLESQLKVQQSIDPGDTTAWNSQQSAIDATRQKLLDLKLEARDLSDDLSGGFREGIEQYVDSLGGPFKKITDLARSTADAMQQGFSDFFFDVMTGKIDDIGHAMESMLNSIQRAMANVLAQMATEGLIGGMKSWLGPAAAASGAGMGGVDTAAMAHQGGLILHEGGMVVPRFHFGGLASDEVPAVLLKRERVLSIEQNKLFEKFVNKTEGPGGLSVAVNVQNQSSQPVNAKTGALQFDGKRYVVDVVLEDIYSGGDLYHALGAKR